ncbi:MAG TPA: hypothetical protein PK413_13430 [Thermoanaerobaculia bacterium]|nr:hypothetical protein [Thermoanaerobaculia bacterium]
MADIVYNRNFTHADWIDNEDVVQAEGENGFNVRFKGLQDELDKVSATFAVADSEVKKIQRLQFLQAVAGVNLPAATASPEFDVEIYSRDTLPPNVEKVYSVILFPVAGPTNIQHTLLYRSLPANKMKVTVQFFNPGAAQASFNFRVLTLATQA